MGTHAFACQMARPLIFCQKVRAEYPSGLRGRIANPLFIGSNPISASSQYIEKTGAKPHFTRSGAARLILRVPGVNLRFPFNNGCRRYRQWLVAAKLGPFRVELVRKDMVNARRPRLAAWIRTTWMPYTDRNTELLRQRFIDEIVAAHLAAYRLGPGHMPAACSLLALAVASLLARRRQR
jgi:hypothetical protein